jgi:hypothetical protein
MINRDDIEAGDKVYTRDGGCLVAYKIYGCTILAGHTIKKWSDLGGFADGSTPNPLDIIRIEKAPKPVVEEVLLVQDDDTDWITLTHTELEDWKRAIKLTIINGKLEKSEQVK